MLLEQELHFGVVSCETIRFYHRTHVFFADMDIPSLLQASYLKKRYFYPDFEDEEVTEKLLDSAQ